MRPSRLASSLVAALFVLLCTIAPRVDAAVDYTDTWQTAGGTEPGWGVNFAHTGDFIFATFFIYGPNGAPVWYTAQLNRTIGDNFSGGLYITSGTWFGAPIFVPVPPSNVVLVGDATFTATSSSTGLFRYRVDTVTVNKTLERFTTVPFSVAGVYLGGIAGTVSGNCPSGTPAAFAAPLEFLVTQTAANVVRLEFDSADSASLGQLVCVMQGTATQSGKLLQSPAAAYQCANGFSSTANIASIRLLDNGIEGHWTASRGGSCVESGRFAGVTQ